jgi:multidrug transporter EmrE-like cation transporter
VADPDEAGFGERLTPMKLVSMTLVFVGALIVQLRK